jgi:hypothetical protein
MPVSHPQALSGQGGVHQFQLQERLLQVRPLFGQRELSDLRLAQKLELLARVFLG